MLYILFYSNKSLLKQSLQRKVSSSDSNDEGREKVDLMVIKNINSRDGLDLVVLFWGLVGDDLLLCRVVGLLDCCSQYRVELVYCWLI